MCHKVTSFENVCDKVFEKNVVFKHRMTILPWIWMIYNNHGLVFLHTNSCEKIYILENFDQTSCIMKKIVA